MLNVELLNVPSEHYRLDNDKVAAIHNAGRWFQLIILAVLPLDQVIVDARRSLNGRNHSFNLVEED